MQDESYRPGITGAGSLVFRKEEEILKSVDPEELETFYQDHIKPLKAEIDSCYMQHATCCQIWELSLRPFGRA